jgi:hypothetical protein
VKQRTLLAALIFSVLLIWTLPAFAANTMTVTPVWRPGQQLTTLTSSSDFRYVDVELTITGNIQFWAANMACVLTPAVLQGYNEDTTVSTLDPGDDIPMVTWGPEWGAEGTEFVPVSVGTDPDGGGPLTAPDGFDFNATSGTLTLRATRLGSVAPLGVNGANYTMLLATLRMRVRDLGSGFTTNSATIKCTPMDFLDRDGRVVVKGKQAATPALAVRTGYSVTGQALLQGGSNHAGTEVECTLQTPPNSVYTATTSSTGSYSFGSTGQLIRQTGFYECVYVSPIVSPRSEFLDAQIDLNLNSSTLFLLPVILKAGNVDATTGSSVNDIDLSDLTLFTAGWLPGPVASAYTGLDVNGDSTVNEADLAMFAGNYDPQSTLTNVDGSHVLYGLATDYGGTFPNSRVYWGDSQAGMVQRLEDPKLDRDFWPNMSPDGSKVVFSRFVSKTGKYLLYTSPTAKPKGVQLTPKSGFTDDALAPAWSPDGQRVAFICSEKTQTSGYEFNEGDLCIINANGANVQQVATGGKIYPPAWFDNNVIIFAGQADHPTVGCQRNLCFIDLATGASGPVSAGLLADGNDVADMPGIASFLSGAAEAKALFYRFDDGSTNSLRARTVTYTGGVFTLGTAATIATPAGGNDIDFYNVSPAMDVMYYESVVTSSVFSTIDVFTNRNFTVNGTLSADDWAAADTHNVDGFVGNITVTGGSIPGGIWNGDAGIPTPYHAQRATFDWIP